MTEFEFVMRTPGARKVELSEIVDKLPPNQWCWTIFNFEGLGGEFGGYEAIELEEATRKSGVQMNSSELATFAATIVDLWWIVAIAHAAEERVPVEVAQRRDFSHCIFVLEGQDSTWWIARSPIGDPIGDAALRRIRAAYGHLA